MALHKTSHIAHGNSIARESHGLLIAHAHQPSCVHGRGLIFAATPPRLLRMRIIYTRTLDLAPGAIAIAYSLSKPRGQIVYSSWEIEFERRDEATTQVRDQGSERRSISF